MRTETKGRIVCYIFAVILFFLGIGVEITTTNSSFLCSLNVASTTDMTSTVSAISTGVTSNAMLYSNNQVIEEVPVCTLGMLASRTEALRGNMSISVLRKQSRGAFFILIAGIFLQYLLGRLIQEGSYQGTESREDGQLFLCRTVVVDYIHRKDSGE